MNENEKIVATNLDENEEEFEDVPGPDEDKTSSECTVKAV